MISVRMSTGGFLFAAKWKLGALCEVEGRVECSTPRTTFSRYPGPGGCGVFEPDRVWIETEDGNLLQERKDPRASFRGLRRTARGAYSAQGGPAQSRWTSALGPTLVWIEIADVTLS